MKYHPSATTAFVFSRCVCAFSFLTVSTSEVMVILLQLTMPPIRTTEGFYCCLPATTYLQASIAQLMRNVFDDSEFIRREQRGVINEQFFDSSAVLLPCWHRLYTQVSHTRRRVHAVASSGIYGGVYSSVVTSRNYWHSHYSVTSSVFVVPHFLGASLPKRNAEALLGSEFFSRFFLDLFPTFSFLVFVLKLLSPSSIISHAHPCGRKKKSSIVRVCLFIDVCTVP